MCLLCEDMSVNLCLFLATIVYKLCRIHCTYMGGYTSKEITGSTYQDTACDEINFVDFKIHNASPGVVGRCFIEVILLLKNSSVSVSFPFRTLNRKSLKNLHPT